MKFTEGGVCAANGFAASGMRCGIREGKTKEDLSLIFSKAPCQGAGLFTRNKVKAAPVLLDMEPMPVRRTQWKTRRRCRKLPQMHSA